jgi:hypothetical protein
MNRAWIPAGALAGVSVAGLIALGPLTDSMGTQVSFPTTVQVVQQPSANPHTMPVSVKLGIRGTTTVNAGYRGGKAASNKVVNSSNLNSGDVGYTGYRNSGNSASTTTKATVTAPPPARKKTVPRPKSITASGEVNGESGFAGAGDNQKTANGEQSQTPGTNGN